MNDRIFELAEQAWTMVSDEERDRGELYEADKQRERRDQVFAELIVRMCADYADMAQDADCEYAGDYVAEAMGYGEEEGITTWRAKV